MRPLSRWRPTSPRRTLSTGRHGVGRVATRHGFGYLLDRHRGIGDTGARRGSRAEGARDLDELGPTFVKFGQLLSTRPDIAAAGHRGGAARAPGRRRAGAVRGGRAWSSAEELGLSIERAFFEFEEKPVAAASIGQVHRATLPNGGRCRGQGAAAERGAPALGRPHSCWRRRPGWRASGSARSTSSIW